MSHVGHVGGIPEDDERVVPMRLQKFLARSGAASRRGSEDLMTAGRVKVNGEVVTELGSRVDPLIDVVTVDDRPVGLRDQPVYLVLNKPAGYVTTMSDPQGRPTVAALMPDDIPGLFPVGRLDRDTTGALLLTTDGALAHRVMHPSFHVAKVYEVGVDAAPTEKDLDRLRTGITLEDGPCKPAVVELVAGSSAPAVARITISEGRKRQVKRMFQAIGHPVVCLHRSRFGPVGVEGVPTGGYRELTDAEIESLRDQAYADREA